jgi:hypothetical protein
MLLLALMMSALADPLPPVELGVIPDPVVQAARSASGLPLADRMKAVSEPLLGLPYEIDGHGEGMGPDVDPPARYDAFDCVTFLEEVLALSLAPDPVGAPAIRNALRYRDGVPDYSGRHHFMLAQWIPANIEAGFFEDITHTLGETHRIEKTVTRAVWNNWAGTHGFSMSAADLPVGTYGLNVLSLDEAEAAIEQIPAGAVIFTVRRPRDWKPIVISHVGFVIHTGEGVPPMMRHATKMSGGSVRDHLLSWYIDHLRWYKRPVEGISVLMPLDQGPRAARVQEK